MIRTLDGLSRIVIPREFIDTLKIARQSLLEIHLIHDGFFIKRADANAVVNDLTIKIRKLDSLGRVVIPTEFRKKLDINSEGLAVKIFLYENGIYIRKAKAIKSN